MSQTGEDRAYYNSLKKIEELERELSAFRAKAPLVGVRFYGQGGFGIGLSTPIAGQTRVALEGYNSSAVIDLSAWLRVRGTEECKAGILVRDDSVIEEKGVSGVIAEVEKKVNPNSFTDAQILEFLKNSSIRQLKTIADNMTHHFAPRHVLEAAKLAGFNDKSKLSPFDSRYVELFTRFKWALLNIHDLRLACEVQRISYDIDDVADALIDKLTKLELKNLEQE